MISRDGKKPIAALPALKHAPNLTPDGSTDITTTICHDAEAPDDDDVDDSWKKGKDADDKNRVTDRCLRREILKEYDSYCAEKKERTESSTTTTPNT